jgi:hypothetical protein
MVLREIFSYLPPQLSILDTLTSSGLSWQGDHTFILEEFKSSGSLSLGGYVFYNHLFFAINRHGERKKVIAQQGVQEMLLSDPILQQQA